MGKNKRQPTIPTQPEASVWSHVIRFGAAMFAVLFSLFGGVLMAENFWWGMVCAYGGFLIILLEVWTIPDLKSHPRLRACFLVIPPIVAGIVTYTFGFAPAPIKVEVLDYFAGVSKDESGRIGDVQWKERYYDVRLIVSADQDYSTLKISVGTDLNIAEVGRFGKCQEGSIEPGMRISPIQAWDDAGNKAAGKDEVTLGNTTAKTIRYQYNWVLRCDQLKAGSPIQFVLAVVSVDRSDLHKLLPPQRPKWVDVNIEYETMGHRVRRFSVRKQLVQHGPS